MFPKKGNVFPGRGDAAEPQPDYAAAVAAALKSELGDTHRAIKTAMRWTGADERTVKNWFRGEIGPSGHYLLGLIRESSAVLHALLHAAGRTDVLTAIGARSIDERIGAQWESRSPPHGGRSDRSQDRASKARRSQIQAGGPVNDPEYDPDNDPDRDPNHDTERGLKPVAMSSANVRQRWLLGELAHGRRVDQRDIRDHFSVSEKTAKRDIAGLKFKGLIVFTGSCRSGRYTLSEEAGNNMRGD